MRKLILTLYMSLDGVIEDPAWSMPYWADDIAAFKFDELFASDALVLGRVTYEGFAQAWPSATDEQGFADRINSMPKFVATRTLDSLAWQAQPLDANVPEAVSALKQQDGQALLIYGSGGLAQTLMQHNLIDEYRLLVYPVVLGQGARLFRDASAPRLSLVESKQFSSGVVLLTYQPAQPA